MSKDKTSRSHPAPSTLATIGIVGVAAAAAGTLLLSRSSKRPEIGTDAPHWTLDKAGNGERPVVGKTLLINAPRQKLFNAWRRVEDFPRFMENVESVEKLGADLSRWTIKAPAGTKVTLVNQISEVADGDYISWQSTAESDVANSGKVSFEDAPEGRGTYVALVVSYEPPAGTVGKLFQREPAIQARRDLRRFKQWIETGEVTSNAASSGRSSESPTEARI
jgi:uncharacterized membrane protein